MAQLSRGIAQGADDADESAAGAVTLGGIAFNNVDATDEWIGLRFQNITIPQGREILNAFISLIPFVTQDEPDVTIYGEDVDNAAQFAASTNDISGRTKTTASVAWDVADLGSNPDSPPTLPDDYFDTPDLTSIIQEIVDRVGWSSGNAIAILITSTNGTATRDLSFHAYESEGSGEGDGGDGTYAAVLTIEYLSETIFTPDPVVLELATPAPAFVSGAVALTPSPVALQEAVATPSFAGALVVAPDPVPLVFAVVEPVVDTAPTLRPEPVPWALTPAQPAFTLEATVLTPEALVWALATGESVLVARVVLLPTPVGLVWVVAGAAVVRGRGGLFPGTAGGRLVGVPGIGHGGLR